MSSQKRSTPLNIAHRGARGFAPENTIEAIDKAAVLGADMVELDVQLTADGQLVVVHDDTLERCSDVRPRFPARSDYRVGSFTLAEIQTLDAGSWFARAIESEPGQRPPFLQSLHDEEKDRTISFADRDQYRSGKVRHPTLQEALERAVALNLLVNVELKLHGAHSESAHFAPGSRAAGGTSARDLVDEALRTIVAMGATDRVLVSSFDHASLRLVKELQSNIPTAVLTESRISDAVAYCRELGATAYHPGYYHDDDEVGFASPHYLQTGHLPAEPLRTLQEAGIAVNVWTENDPGRMRCLIEAGIDGIFTDYPNRMAEELKKLK